MKVEKDYEEFLKLFNKNKVKYCIIGAFAVALYGEPRYTKDIDILVEPNKANAQRIIKALNEFGFGSLKLSEEDFAHPHKIIQLGYEPVRIDLLTSIAGCSFKEVWKSRQVASYGRQKVYFIGKKELIKSKKVANRGIDKVDLGKLSGSRKRFRGENHRVF